MASGHAEAVAADDGVVELAALQHTEEFEDTGPGPGSNSPDSGSSNSGGWAADADWVATRLKRPRWMPDDEVHCKGKGLVGMRIWRLALRFEESSILPRQYYKFTCCCIWHYDAALLLLA